MTAAKSDRRDSSLKTELAHEILDENTIESPKDNLRGRDSLEDVSDESTDRDRKDRAWTLAERLTRIVASIGVAVAAVIGAMQYKAANEEQRSKRSFDVVRDWQTLKFDEDFAVVQLFVEPRLGPVFATLELLEPDAQILGLKNLARRWLDENRALNEPEEIEGSLDNLVLFFSQMEICIDAGLCEGEVLQRYFRSEVISFWGYFSAYADMRREAGYQDYGSSVDGLVKRFAGTWE